MKKLTSLLLLCILSSTICYAQNSSDKARKDITMLKNGALFVRLKTSELKINALKSKGREKEAEEIRENQELVNKSIMAAFKANYTFSPVYFFYSDKTTNVKEGNYKGLIFDTDMKVDSSFTGNNYLIGEFEESATTQMNAFFIKDKDFELLKNPFPYFIKRNQAFFSTRSNEQLVAVLNSEFFEFYGR